MGDGDPDDGDRQDERDGGGRAVSDSGRVTLDFSGPPLSLPRDGAPSGSETGDPAQGAGRPERRETGPLELDTSQLDSSEMDMGAAAAAGDGSERDTGPLELDTSELEPPPPAHDAWTADQVRRGSTVPPMGEGSAGSDAPREVRPDEASHPSPHSEAGDALGLVDRQQRPSGEVDLASEMADRYALGDFTGALRAAELLLGREPDHPAAPRYAQSSRERLEQLYSSRLGSLAAVPEVAVPEAEVRWLGLDHREGFLVSRIDGSASVEQLVDVSGMARLEALKTLVELLDRGVIRL